MAINQYLFFEELNGVKCAIVEKNVPSARVEFLRGILEYNRYTVVVVPSPPPKAVPAGGSGGGWCAAGAGGCWPVAAGLLGLRRSGPRNLYGWGDGCNVQRSECCFRAIVKGTGRACGDAGLLAAKGERVA